MRQKHSISFIVLAFRSSVISFIYHNKRKILACGKEPQTPNSTAQKIAVNQIQPTRMLSVASMDDADFPGETDVSAE